MVGTINSILPPGLKEQITAIRQSDRASQSLTKQLASGLDIMPLLMVLKIFSRRAH